jgi:hypothetical protein
MIKSEYFTSPVYYEDKPEWVDKLNKLSDPYITQARKDQEEKIKNQTSGIGGLLGGKKAYE